VLASILLSSSASRVVVNKARDVTVDLFPEDKERMLLLLPLFEIDDDDARKLVKGRSMEEEEDATVDDAFNIMIVVVLFCAMCSSCLSLLMKSAIARFLLCGDVFQKSKTSSH